MRFVCRDYGPRWFDHCWSREDSTQNHGWSSCEGPKRAETLGPRRIPKVIMSSCLVHRLQGGSNKVTRIYTTVCFLTSMCQNASRFVIFSTANFYIRRRKVSRAFFFISHVVVMSHLDMWLTEEYKDLNAHLWFIFAGLPVSLLDVLLIYL